MNSIAYCALLPKPFPYCQVCARNPVHALASWKTKFKLPIVDTNCRDFIKLEVISNNGSDT